MCGIDKVTFYDTWKSIQGQKFWLSGEYLTNYACKQEKQPPFLSAGVVLDFFQQLAIWLILYSSEYQQNGFLKKINRLQIIKWREIPAWLHLTLDVRARKDNSIFFEGKIFSENQLIVWLGELELSLVPFDNSGNLEELKRLGNFFLEV